jgi:hypothetical protein
MPSRRLEDRIRELSVRIASTPNTEFQSVLSDLQVAMHEFARRLENKTSASIFDFPDLAAERRKHS